MNVFTARSNSDVAALQSGASSIRASVKPDRKPPWGELEGDEKDGCFKSK